MRFEVIAALVIGILLPVLETCRRGFAHWAVDFTTMFEDYLGGAVLLIGAWAAYTARSWGATFLAIAWGAITGLMTLSLVSQLEDTIRGTATEPHNLVVIFVKFLLWATAAGSLVFSFRSALRSRPNVSPRD
jgi:hypothetical protein